MRNLQCLWVLYSAVSLFSAVFLANSYTISFYRRCSQHLWMQDAQLGHMQILKGRNRAVRPLFPVAPSGTRWLCATNVPEPKKVSPSPAVLHGTDEKLEGLWPTNHTCWCCRHWSFCLKINGVGSLFIIYIYIYLFWYYNWVWIITYNILTTLWK